MSSAARSFLTAGAALLGAATVVVPSASALPSVGDIHPMSSRSYGLTTVSTALAVGGSSAANIPVNLFNLVMSVPAWEVEAMGRLADAMDATGSWQVWGPTNVFGFDEQDPPKLQAVVDMMVPIQPVSAVLGEDLSWWARANLPMNAGCAAVQSACPDPKAMLDSMFTVPPAQLFDGYQFPAVTNPFTGEPTSWSGQYVKLDSVGPWTALEDYLTAPPVGVETVDPGDAVTAVSRLAKSSTDAFYPFVQNSQWFDDRQTVLAPVFRALSPVLCESCEANPYDNPWLQNYGQHPVSAQELAARAAAPVAAAAGPANTTPESASLVRPALSPPADSPVANDPPVEIAGPAAAAGRHRLAGDVAAVELPGAGRHRAPDRSNPSSAAGTSKVRDRSIPRG